MSFATSLDGKIYHIKVDGQDNLVSNGLTSRCGGYFFVADADDEMEEGEGGCTC